MIRSRGLVIRGKLGFSEVLISRTLSYPKNFGRKLSGLSLFSTTCPGSVPLTVSTCSSAACHTGLLLGFLLDALPVPAAAGCDAAGSSARAPSGR